MICAIYCRLVVLTAVIGLWCIPTVAQQMEANASRTLPVTVRWSARPGVTRYRLQVAHDRGFADIVFDGVVHGLEYQIDDLAPGTYFWRVASLDRKIGEFSSPSLIEVSERGAPAASPGALPARDVKTLANASVVATRNGWYAAFPDVLRPTPAHLRSTDSVEVVATADENRVIAIEAVTGIALWIRQLNVKSGTGPLAVAVRNRHGLDDVLSFSGSAAFLLDGKSGREIGHASLPGVAVTAVSSGVLVVAIDSSLQRAFLLEASTARLISEVRLPARIVGNPLFTSAFGSSSLIMALEDGRLEVFDQTGKLTHSGNAAGVITTGPLVVQTQRGKLVLVGTREGLTALNGEDLRPLGRVTLSAAPRGSLYAQDLDHDGTPEVVLFTDSGHVVVVKSDEGKVIWETDARRAEAASFADVNGDHVLDLLIAGREGSAFVLSGRDGAIIWKDKSPAQVVTNHAPAIMQRSSLVVSSPTGVLFIATDPGRGGLRALEFPQTIAPRN
jgi:outer membrane protein assembly factor BamB